MLGDSRQLSTTRHTQTALLPKAGGAPSPRSSPTVSRVSQAAGRQHADATDPLWLKHNESLLVEGGPLVALAVDAGHSQTDVWG